MFVVTTLYYGIAEIEPKFTKALALTSNFRYLNLKFPDLGRIFLVESDQVDYHFFSAVFRQS